MNEQEKSLELAKLMVWEVSQWPSVNVFVVRLFNHDELACNWPHLNPYAETESGQAQFASIIMKFPEVMVNVHNYYGSDYDGPAVDSQQPMSPPLHLTQANLLDEILRMNGVEID